MNPTRNNDSKDVDNSLHHAVAQDDLTEVSRLLETGSDINSRDSYDFTPLHTAVHGKNLEMVRYLLAHGADPNMSYHDAAGDVDEYNDATVLATQRKASAIMQEMITQGFKIHSRALSYAAAVGYMDMVRLFLEDPTVEFSDMTTQKAIEKALPAACRSWSYEMVQYLILNLDSSWVAKQKGNDRQGALNLALLGVFDRDGAQETYPDLMVEPEVESELDWSLATQVVKLVVGAGASANVHISTYGCSPLHYALRPSNLPSEMIKFLVANGAELNVTSWMGQGPTAFFDLLVHPNATDELIECFVKRGGVMKVVDLQGNSPLHRVRNVGVARWLIASGASLAARNNLGEAPLHTASQDGRVEIVSELLIAGASVDERNNSGRTPLMLSFGVEVSKVLLKHGADVNAATDSGWTALHEFAEKCDLEQTNLLLANDADVDALATQERCIWNPGPTWATEMVSKQTPLHVAVYIREAVLPEIVTALLDYGADMEIRDSSGKTPLILAIATDGFGAPIEGVVNCLLDRGADSEEACDEEWRNAHELADARQYRISDEGKFERKPGPQPGHRSQAPYVHVFRGLRGRGGRGGMMYI